MPSEYPQGLCDPRLTTNQRSSSNLSRPGDRQRAFVASFGTKHANHSEDWAWPQFRKVTGKPRVFRAGGPDSARMTARSVSRHRGLPHAECSLRRQQESLQVVFGIELASLRQQLILSGMVGIKNDRANDSPCDPHRPIDDSIGIDWEIPFATANG